MDREWEKLGMQALVEQEKLEGTGSSKGDIIARGRRQGSDLRLNEELEFSSEKERKVYYGKKKREA